MCVCVCAVAASNEEAINRLPVEKGAEQFQENRKVKLRIERERDKTN